MSEAGYYRFPTIHGDTIVFVSEDDLWSAPAAGGPAHRLTSNLGEVSYPSFSPDGAQLAFVGREEGQSEVYVMPAAGGPARRLTYLASRCRVLGWDAAGTHILFNSTYGQLLGREIALFRVAAESANGAAEPLPYGPARSVSFGGQGQVVLGRNTGDPARWKRYRGGTTGHLWIDLAGDGAFVRLLPDMAGNIASPMWIETQGGPRIFFVSDHEGIANLYSCRPDGSELRRHTDHEEYYVRNTSTDGRRIVYHAGGDLYVYDVATDRARQVAVEYNSPRVQRNRRFVSAAHYLNTARLHPSGQAIALTTRGKAYAFFNFDGPVVQLGKRDGVRYRLGDWLNDGQRLVVVSDDPGEEVLEVYDAEPGTPPRRLEGLDIGRPLALKASPTEEKVALVNHRHELMVVDLEKGAAATVDRSPYRLMAGFDWSPDGRWLAYGYGATVQTTELRLCRLASEEDEEGTADDKAAESGPLVQRNPDGSAVYRITQPVLHDIAPSFDPEGKYLYFLSHREFNPVYDGLHFDLGFPWGMRPYLLTLQAELPNPFVPHPELGPEDEEDEDEEGDGEDEEAEEGDRDEDEAGAGEGESEAGDAAGDGDGDEDGKARPVRRTASAEGPSLDTGLFEHAGAGADKQGEKAEDKRRERKKRGPRLLEIDLENIERRIFAFPVPDGRYGQIAGIKGKALFTDFPIEGQLDSDEGWSDDDDAENGVLRAYTFADYRDEVLADNVNWFDLALNGKKLLYGSGTRLRVIAAGEKAPGGSGHPRKTGWVDLSRVKVSIRPQSEWEQMFREAWRLQRDHFWTEDMAQVDWQAVYRRYFPLIGRVSTRGEFSDLMWEMQGELGTSHAYEYGGDYRPGPHYSQGFLGAAFTWDGEAGGYRVGEVLVGDPWDARATSPLAEPGMNVRRGDLLVAINGQPLDEETSPAQLLVNQAGQTVLLSFAMRPGEGGREREPEELHHIGVRALASESQARYRAWVEANRGRVHAATGGRVGYVHIPDMGPGGYAEFHRGYLAEVDRDALIVDVRYNGGGHVSQLILEKLARRRIGYDLSRWGGLLPYPQESVAGPLVALTNEHAGSDGDIFCHSFKLLKLGPLVGKRTWGGVIGISPHHPLVDGTVTTQPEFSFWFEDVGWNVENYGTEPDIEVENAPQDYRAGTDRQLERAVAEALRLLEDRPVLRPDLANRPSRALPRLPAR